MIGRWIDCMYVLVVLRMGMKSLLFSACSMFSVLVSGCWTEHYGKSTSVRFGDSDCLAASPISPYFSGSSDRSHLRRYPIMLYLPMLRTQNNKTIDASCHAYLVNLW
jgi:hypothetical protein